MNPSGFADAVIRSYIHAEQHRQKLTPSPITTFDIKPSAQTQRRAKAHFEKVRRASVQYAINLRKIARHVGDLINMFPAGDSELMPTLLDLLNRYANIIRPWASNAAAEMIADVYRRDELAWFRSSEIIGRLLADEVRNAPTGELARQLHYDQVELITSLPIEAGERVQKLTTELMTGGRRYDEAIPMIMNSGNVTIARATLIARTETAKASSTLMEARATHIGSPGYIWHSVRDFRVRKRHRELEGTYHEWTNPPVAEENGERHHPGMFPNCRCYAEPIIPDVIS